LFKAMEGTRLKVEKREHLIWKEGAHDILGHKIVGRWQYIYTTDKGRISLVQLYGYPMGIGKMQWKSFVWEICGGGLTEDVERFRTKKEAEKRIRELLGE